MLKRVIINRNSKQYVIADINICKYGCDLCPIRYKCLTSNDDDFIEISEPDLELINTMKISRTRGKLWEECYGQDRI